MPQGPVPAEFNDILESTTLGNLATIDEHGLPNVNPVWFLWDGEHVLLSVRPVTKKYKSLRHDPHLAMSFVDPSNPYRYVEIRGEIVDWQLYTTLDFVNQLSHKYTGADFTSGHAGQERYKVTIRVDSWTGQ